MTLYNIISLVGIFGLLFTAWLFSSSRRTVNLRLLVWGLLLQLILALLVFQAPGSSRVMLTLNDAFVKVINVAQAGPAFLLGPLIEPTNTSGFVLLLQGLPMIIFFSALMAVLYYLRIMPLLIRAFSSVFTRLMRVSGAESLCVSSSIFVGIEALTTIRPYLARMTRSELCTIMTAGLCTIASTMLGIYVFFLKDTFPTIAGHLVTASLLSAPAGVIMAKLLVPETENPLTLGKNVKPAPVEDGSLMEALINGSMAGVKLLVGLAALLLAMVGMLALINMLIAGMGGLFDAHWTLESLLGYIFYPFALLCGVPPADALWVGTMLAKRMILTELPIYQELGAALNTPGFNHSPRAVVILIYSLCGFAHIPSMAVFIGGLSALVPERKDEIARMGIRALIAATLACMLTGAIAGMLYTGQDIVINIQP